MKPINLSHVHALVPELAHATPEAVFLAEVPTGTVVACNSTALQLINKPHNTIIGGHITNLHPPEQSAYVQSLFRECVHLFSSGLAAPDSTMELMSGDGRRIPCSLMAKHIVDEQGQQFIAGFFSPLPQERGVADQVDDHWRYQAAIIQIATTVAKSPGPFTDMAAAVNEIISRSLNVNRVSVWLLNSQQTKLEVVDHYALASSLHSDGFHLLAHEFPRYFEALNEDRAISAHDAYSDPRTSEFCSGYLQENDIYAMLDAPLRKGGSVAGVICCEHTGSSRQWQRDEINFVSEASNLLSQMLIEHERQGALSALEHSENSLRTTLDAITDGVVSVDAKGIIRVANPVARDFIGLNERYILNKPFADIIRLYDQEKRALSATVVEFGVNGGREIYPSLYLQSHTGEERRVAVNVSPNRSNSGTLNGAVCVLRDCEEQAQLEDCLRQSQKMDAVGQLAGGVAHDFNNLLTGIMGSCDLLESGSFTEREQKLIRMISRAAHRAADLTSKLLAFSRKSRFVNEDVDLHHVIEDTEALLRHTIAPNITIEVKLNASRHHITGDGGELEAAILNLCLNARDAMPDGGSLYLRTEDDEQADGPLHLTIADTGTGMDQGTLQRIWEPFFTTKKKGHGTGLGLPAVYGIIHDHNGIIDVSSHIGKGSCFEILLPCIRTGTTAHRQKITDLGVVPQTGTVLIINDDEIVRTTCQKMMQSLGWQTLTANDGNAGLEKWQQQQSNIDLIILDLVMPGRSGKECLQLIRAQNPTIPVLIVSGFTEDLNIERGPATDFLRKPFHRTELDKAVRSLNEA